MRSYDLAPLFRSTVGFDRLAGLLDTATRLDETALSYPPYNIEKLGEESYRITMAVAGFSLDELDIVSQENTLVVSGKAAEDDKARSFLHHGIARRAFERRFQLADHIRVTGASLSNGLLNIQLVREVPEVLKPRKIEIAFAGGESSKKVLEQKAA